MIERLEWWIEEGLDPKTQSLLIDDMKQWVKVLRAFRIHL